MGGEDAERGGGFHPPCPSKMNGMAFKNRRQVLSLTSDFACHLVTQLRCLCPSVAVDSIHHVFRISGWLGQAAAGRGISSVHGGIWLSGAMTHMTHFFKFSGKKWRQRIHPGDGKDDLREGAQGHTLR